jgi:NADPH-dependent 7-cyano-7-deazaguanine reductase QueF
MSCSSSSLCPLGRIETQAWGALRGGAPDFGTIRITYVQAQVHRAEESSSICGASEQRNPYERAVNRILDDLATASPKWMRVVGDSILAAASSQ